MPTSHPTKSSRKEQFIGVDANINPKLEENVGGSNISVHNF